MFPIIWQQWARPYDYFGILADISMDRVEELCGYYTAFLRCIYLQHQNSHWITNGNDFYGNHLLFERIYKSAAENADLAAEKFIGLFGLDTLDLHAQAQMIGKILAKYSSGMPLDSSLEIEKKFLAFSEKFYEVVEKDGKMSLGLDDMIMHIASDREGAVYLLKQAAGKKDVDIPQSESKVAARISLLTRIKRAQDAQDAEAKLTTELVALVVSEIPGQYNTGDITVSIDAMSNRVIGSVKVSTPVPPNKQAAIEKSFMKFARNLLPAGQKDFMVGVGFSYVKR